MKHIVYFRERKALTLVLLLVAILITSTWLLTNKVLFKNKAADSPTQLLEITDENGNKVNCNGNVCYTDSNNLFFKYKGR